MAFDQFQRKDSSISLVNFCYCSVTSTVKCYLKFKWNLLNSSLYSMPLVLNCILASRFSYTKKRFPPCPLLSRLKTLITLSFPLWRGVPVPQAPQRPYAGLSPVHSCLLLGGRVELDTVQVQPHQCQVE